MRHRFPRALVASVLAGLLAVAGVLVAQPAATALTSAPQHSIQACTEPAWSPSTVYVGGDRVQHDGNAWRAKWWTQGEEPGTTGEWGVWEQAGSCDPTDPPTDPPPPAGSQSAAPYLHLGWGNPPNAVTVMNSTGLRAFTMAFMLSGGGCVPRWDGQRALQGGVDAQVINQIRAAGGDVSVSFGGWSGNKLGPNCSSAQALAGAIQQVIDAYNLDTVDMDVENIDEFESPTVQDRILGALRIVKQNNPGITTVVTIPVLNSGPNFWGSRLIDQARALGANVDVFNIMTFNFGGGADMFGAAVSASQGLNAKLRSTFGWSEAVAYQHMGITGMIGRSDQGEITSPAAWTQIRNWADQRSLAKLAFWSTNRDRPCPGGGANSSCSGISQTELEFSRITAQFGG
ncbi:MAG: carbohydrate-binding protein [Natronosporangium sp.]